LKHTAWHEKGKKGNTKRKKKKTWLTIKILPHNWEPGRNEKQKITRERKREEKKEVQLFHQELECSTTTKKGGREVKH